MSTHPILRWAEITRCDHLDGCVVLRLGNMIEHLPRASALALADDLAAILDTDTYVPRHARVTAA